jgi:CysZ protein
VETVRTPQRPAGAAQEFFAGTAALGRGFGLVWRSPGLMLLGMVPGVISAIVVLSALGTLLYFVDDVAATVTWFADDWSEELRSAVRLLAALGIAVVGVLLAVLTFTSITLVIGDPFYEEISKRVEDRLGGTPSELDAPWYRTMRWNLVDSLRLLALSALTGVLLFVAGLIPVLGQTVVPVVGAFLGGWLLAVEVSGIPFNRRGLRLRDRRRILRAHRPLALGLGVPLFLLFLVPFAAIVVMPAAVAGATLVTRRALGLPDR